MTIKALYPTVEPSLELDFANTKALDPRISFTRASTGTCVGADGLIKTAASGVARFDHSTTGGSLGLLVEEARTNLLTYSEQFNDASWTKYGTSITANSITAPDGTQTADLIVESSGAANRGFYNIISVSAIPYTYSIYVKQKERKFITLTSALGSGDFRVATFDVNAGTVTNSIASTATITFVGNGWYRCAITYTATATGSWYVGAQMSDSGAAGYQYSYTGDGTSGIYIWGAQLEAGSFPTSYIPTTTSTVTRAADVASMTGTNFSSWFNRNDGTFLCNAQNLNAEPNPPLILTATPFYQGAGGYKLGLSGFWSSVSQLSTDAWANGVGLGGSVINVSETQAASATIRHSFAYSPTECRACVKQTLGTVGGSQCFQAAQGLDRLLFQQYFGITSSRIKRLAFYPVRLPDAQLQALTAT